VFVFAATAVAVYLWERLKAEPAAPAGGYTATAVVRWRTTAPAGSDDGLSLPPSRPDPREIQRQLVSEPNLRRAVRELGACVAPLPGEKGESTLTRAVADVQQNLRVVVDAAAESDRMQVSIRCTQAQPQYATRLANTLAEHFAADYRRQWKVAAQQAHAAAEEVLRRAEQPLRAAKAHLDEFSRQHLKRPQSADAEAPQAGPQATEPQRLPATVAAEPALVENPQWVDLNGQLEVLQCRRAALLVDRLPEHPAIRDADLRIADLTHLLATKPRWIAAERSEPAGAASAAASQPPNESPPPSRPPGGNPPAANRGDPASTEADRQQVEEAVAFEELKDAADRADQARDLALRRERQAWQATLQELQVEVQPAAFVETPPASAAGLRLVLAALASGLVVTAGIAMISAATSWEPTLTTIAEVEALLPVPVVGIIPATMAAGGRGRPRHSQASIRALLFVCGLMIIALCLGIMLLRFGGQW
jgi:capsular polysaccharide biosynthesis protein